MLSEHLKKDAGRNLSKVEDLFANTRPLVLFGAGAIGESVAASCAQKGIRVACFCDNSPMKWGSKHAGLDVISYDQFKAQYHDCNIILTIGTEDKADVQSRLRQDGFDRIYPFDLLLFDYIACESFVRDNLERFEQLYQLLEDEQSRRVLIARLRYMTGSDSSQLSEVQSEDAYFDSSLLCFSAGEYFVDAGALDGQTALEFAGIAPDYARIVCFEPDRDNYLKTIQNTSPLANIKVYELGLWNEEQTLHFHSNAGGSCISEQGETVVHAVSLDHLLEDEPVTLIKMDIEGAETNALLGAKCLLQRRKPKLAICVYHRMEDILIIPLLLKELVPSYKIYLRHYSSTILDTVCYAIL